MTKTEEPSTRFGDPMSRRGISMASFQRTNACFHLDVQSIFKFLHLILLCEVPDSLNGLQEDESGWNLNKNEEAW